MAFPNVNFHKLKIVAAVAAMYRHVFREVDTPNADPTKKDLNIVLDAVTLEEYLAAIPDKIRRNAVLGIDIVMTVSPEAEFLRYPDRVNDWAIDSYAWLIKTFGQGNIKFCVLHLDETTPHIHALILPLREGRLSARSFIGGPRSRLSELQTSYADAVQHYELERGIRGSRARHEDIKRFYGRLAQGLPDKIPAREPGELAEAYFERNAEYFKTLDAHAVCYRDAATKISNLQQAIQRMKPDIERTVSLVEEMLGMGFAREEMVRVLQKTDEAMRQKMMRTIMEEHDREMPSED